ncbi:MAG: hypothetical protein QOG64_1724 [Acidimicrobiaceae bacterium]|nr:hypothetical protein [Acidimicrobiaceae bacterium]
MGSPCRWTSAGTATAASDSTSPAHRRRLRLRSRVAALLVMTAVAVCSAPAGIRASAGAEPVAPDAAPGPPTAAPAPPGVWAVVIGIDNYTGSSENLKSAKADAGDMNQLLSKDGVPADHRLTLLDDQASGAAIRSAVDWLVAHSTDATTAILFYAGHVEKLSSSTEAIRGSDNDLVTDADLAAHLHLLHARSAWITIAGCFAGGFDEVLGPGRMLTAASDANHLSYENDSLGRSYLVEYMIRRAMLQQAGDVTVQAAFAAAVAALRHDYPNRVPLQFDDTGRPVDLLEPEGVPAAPPAPATGPPVAGSVVAAANLPEASPAPTAGAAAGAPANAVAAPPPPAEAIAAPLATIATAIDKVDELRAKFVSWLTASVGGSSRTVTPERGRNPLHFHPS